MAVDLRDDILRLARGKSSRSKIGSRKTPHRLRNYEWIRLEIALKKGILVKKKSDREALINVYSELMKASNREPIITEDKI